MVNGFYLARKTPNCEERLIWVSGHSSKDGDYRVALADFGTLKAQNRDTINPVRWRSIVEWKDFLLFHTQRFTKNVGSTVYMAPEVYAENSDQTYSNKVDVYRLVFKYSSMYC